MEKIEILKKEIREMYRDEEMKPLELTPGQMEIFDSIYHKRQPRIHIMTPTRYGKSMTVALAVLTRCLHRPDNWAIVSHDQQHSQIIMDKITKHIFDNPAITAILEMPQGATKESLRIYRNKKKLTFKLGEGMYSEIYVQTAKEALGFGAPNVVEDEAAMIIDEDHSFVMRMLGDQPNNFLVKIGNPFTRGHFLKSYRDPDYRKIVIDYYQAVQEGRLRPEYIEEMRKEPNFSVLYENKFPEEESQDKSGYNQLLTEKDLDRAYTNEMSFIGTKVMGIDLAAGGRDYSAIVVRSQNAAKLMYKNQTKDPMVVIDEAVKIAKKEGIPIDDEHIFPDKEDASWSARMRELYPYKPDGTDNNFGVMFGSKPEYDEDETKWMLMGNERQSIYLNRRAQMYMRLQEWVNRGGKLIKKPDFDDLIGIGWKNQSDKRIKIKSKQEMLKDGKLSPDAADALALTFASVIPLTQTRRIKNPNPEFVPLTRFGL